jgi:predicted MFS family arabinose efflux permease
VPRSIESAVDCGNVRKVTAFRWFDEDRIGFIVPIMTIRSSSNDLRIPALVALAVGTFTLGVDGFVLSGLLPEVAADLNISISKAGQLTTIFAFVYAIGSPIIATVTASWDRRALLAAGMVVFVAGMLLQAVGTTFSAVAAGRVVAALGAAAYQANAYSTAGLLSNDEHRARSLAVVAAGSSLSLVAGLPFGILIGHLWGWRSALWALTILAVISGLAVLALPRVYAPPSRLRERVTALGHADVRSLLAGTVSVLLPGFLIVSYLPAILGRTGSAVVIAMLAYGVGHVAGTSFVPQLIRRRSAHFAIVTGAFAMTGSCLALAVGRSSIAAAAGAMLLLGTSTGLTIVPQQHRYFALLPNIATIAMGLNGSAAYVAIALGSATGGLILAATSAASLSPVAAAIGLLAAAITASFVPERKQR